MRCSSASSSDGADYHQLWAKLLEDGREQLTTKSVILDPVSPFMFRIAIDAASSPLFSIRLPNFAVNGRDWRT